MHSHKDCMKVVHYSNKNICCFHPRVGPKVKIRKTFENSDKCSCDLSARSDPTALPFIKHRHKRLLKQDVKQQM